MVERVGLDVSTLYRIEKRAVLAEPDDAPQARWRARARAGRAARRCGAAETDVR